MKKFTLLELLVVVAVIGVLMTLLLPSLQQARAAGYQALCASNQKQLGIATFTYIKKNRGLYMSNWKDSNWAAEGRSGPTDNRSWHYKLRNYLNLTMKSTGQYKEKVPNVLQCPVEPKPYKDNSVRTYCSYQFTYRNNRLKKNPGVVMENNATKKFITTISLPGETVAAVEQHQRSYLNVVGGSAVQSKEFNVMEGAVADSELLYPHKSRKMQLMWVDGHVSMVTSNYLFDTSENTDPNNAQGTLWDSER